MPSVQSGEGRHALDTGPGREGGSAEGWARGHKSNGEEGEASGVWQVGSSRGEGRQQETTSRERSDSAQSLVPSGLRFGWR